MCLRGRKIPGRARDWIRELRTGQLAGACGENRYAAEPHNESNPDAAYEQRWAVTLIEQVLAVLRQEYCSFECCWSATIDNRVQNQSRSR